jgi:hypothetical protein
MSSSVTPGRSREQAAIKEKAMSERTPFPASMYILPATVVGGMTGVIVGTLFDGVIEGRRTLAVLAALAAIAVDYALRRAIGKAFPQLFSGAAGAPPSPPILVVACVVALAGGLATHDLGLIFGVMYGPVLGGFAGLFAALMTAILVMLNETERRKPTSTAL